MKLYRISKRSTGQWKDLYAESAAEACEAMGWMIGDCYVREIQPRVKMTGELFLDEYKRKALEVGASDE